MGEPPQGELTRTPSTLPFLSLSLSPGHAIFKVTYLSNHDYKHLYFESDAATVNEIVLKVSVSPQARRWAGSGHAGPGLRLPAAPSSQHGQGSWAQFAEDELPSGHPGGEHPHPGPPHRSAALLPLQPKQGPLRLPPPPVIRILCVLTPSAHRVFPPFHCQELPEASGTDSEEIVVIR